MTSNTVRLGGADRRPFADTDIGGPPPGIVVDMALTVPPMASPPVLHAFAATPVSLMVAIGDPTTGAGLCHFALSNPRPGSLQRATWTASGVSGWLVMGALPTEPYSNNWSAGVPLACGTYHYRYPGTYMTVKDHDFTGELLPVYAGSNTVLTGPVPDPATEGRALVYIAPATSVTTPGNSLNRPVLSVGGALPDGDGVLWIHLGSTVEASQISFMEGHLRLSLSHPGHLQPVCPKFKDEDYPPVIESCGGTRIQAIYAN